MEIWFWIKNENLFSIIRSVLSQELSKNTKETCHVVLVYSLLEE